MSVSDTVRAFMHVCVRVRDGGRGVALLPRQAGSEVEVDGQAIQPPFTFNERAPRLFARSFACSCSLVFHATTDSKHFVRK